MKNKHFLQFVAILLCTTLLTFSVGRVTRVKAVVTEAAIATGVAIIVGTAFLGYLALSGATVRYENMDTLNDYVGDVGRWVMQHGSGVGLTRLISQASDWVGRQALSALDFTVEYTKDLISDFYNSFNNINRIRDGISVTIPPSLTRPTLDFPYPAVSYPTDYTIYLPSSSYEYVYEVLDGFELYLVADGTFSTPESFSLYQLPYHNLVNYIASGSTYYHIGILVGNTIQSINTTIKGSTPFVIYQNGIHTGYTGYITTGGLVRPWGQFYDSLVRIPTATSTSFPILANRPLYLTDANNNIITKPNDIVVPDSSSVSFPNHGGGNDDDNRNPIIPFVPFPNSPTNPNGFWGSLVDDILDAVGDGLDLAILSELLNAFADRNGGDSILYDDDVINYFYQYDIKNNITQQSEEIPIDLNEISLYTDNRYLTTLTDSVDSVSGVIHDYVGFWYDVDPTVVIVILGSAVLSVVSLLLHKMGG